MAVFVQVLASWYHFFRRLVIWRFAIPALSWMLAFWSFCGKVLVKTVLLGCMLSSAVNSAAEVLCFLVIIFFNIHRPLSVHFGFCGLFLFADNFFLFIVCAVINVGTTHSVNFGPQHLHGSRSVNLHQTVLHCMASILFCLIPVRSSMLHHSRRFWRQTTYLLYMYE